MAIDRGPWNALVDDDGSNLVGTVWNKDKIKTVILDPTDAALAAIPPSDVGPLLTWTPIDVSGAGLVFTLPIGAYQVVGAMVNVWLHLSYPATANGNNAIIGGLPFAPRTTPPAPATGLYSSYGMAAKGHIPNGGTNVYLVNPSTSAFLTNTAVSGAAIILQGSYLKA